MICRMTRDDVIRYGNTRNKQRRIKSFSKRNSKIHTAVLHKNDFQTSTFFRQSKTDQLTRDTKKPEHINE